VYTNLTHRFYILNLDIIIHTKGSLYILGHPILDSITHLNPNISRIRRIYNKLLTMLFHIYVDTHNELDHSEQGNKNLEQKKIHNT